ncbi:MAG: protein translocase subunit SecF [Gammaproteobacteria bacterium]|nr:protein translocase subunit SecF [Gammaproteobacteria bacterium]
MFQILKDTPSIDFMRVRKSAMMVSGVILILLLATTFTRGLNLGIDFTGGTLIEVGYPQSAELGSLRTVLGDNGYNDAIVQHFGTAKDVLVRIAPREGLSSAQLSTQLLEVLSKTENGKPEMRRVEFVGPQIGDELVEKGGLAMLTALGCILLYVWIRFEKRFALGSIAALIHDVIFTIGIFSVLGLEFDLTVLAALLAVIGYSLNDTIVVFDRVRENFRKMRKGTPVDVINNSINQTLSRTLMTSLTTLLVLLALFIFGGELIHGFATALLIGVVVGTYSSIYIASSAALMMGVTKQDLMPPEKEGAEHDDVTMVE